MGGLRYSIHTRADLCCYDRQPSWWPMCIYQVVLAILYIEYQHLHYASFIEHHYYAV